MRLDLSEILHRVGKNIPYDLDETALVDEDIECVEPITGRLMFTNAGSTLLIKGTADTSLFLSCSRCADYFASPVSLSVDEQFELQFSGGGLRETQQIDVIEDDENPIANKLFQGPIFDLTELLRQYLLVEAPTRPIPPCDSEGRCQQCHRLPAEVLAPYQDSQTPEEAAANSPFSRLVELLHEEETE